MVGMSLQRRGEAEDVVRACVSVSLADVLSVSVVDVIECRLLRQRCLEVAGRVLGV